MESFVQKHAKVVMGVLSGFDRLVFRGTLRGLYSVSVMDQYLRCNKVLMKDFGRHVNKVSDRIKAASRAESERLGRPLVYLASPQTSKEDTAREIMRRDGVKEGLICILSCVEPCRSFEAHSNRATKMLELVPRIRKCLHYYHYWLDPELGFMHGRLQTWFPFLIQVCLNGREWLSHGLDREGIAYQKRDNCFTWIEEVGRAQALMDRQLRTDWPRVLGQIARRLNPIHDEVFWAFSQSYYWSVHESEWATDVMFRSPADLAALYPRLLRHGMTTFGSGDVMRFLGHRVALSKEVRPNFQGEVVTDLRTRPEGVRIKHRVNRNSIKMYDKQGSVLRVETTINDPRVFRSYRPREGDGKGDRKWRVMRRGVADIYRRAQVSQAANERYLETLAEVDEDAPLGTLVENLCSPVSWKDHRIRGLDPWGADARLLETVARGEYVVNGFRNRDLRERLFGQSTNDREKRRQSGRVTRMLRLLRAHGLIKKVSHTHRYLLTAKGRTILVALSAAKNVSPRKLIELAA